MPIEYIALRCEPYPVEKCPQCGTICPCMMRGLVHRSKRWLGVGPRRPYCAVICHGCYEIVGWEEPRPEAMQNARRNSAFTQTDLRRAMENLFDDCLLEPSGSKEDRP